ncbi:hypothetical protein [Paraburkholderia sp. BCC1876]|nr:hypothetical protein [Paraburkholderia sp. BCC1876]
MTTTTKHPAPPPSLFNAALTLHLFQRAALQKLTQTARPVNSA